MRDWDAKYEFFIEQREYIVELDSHISTRPSAAVSVLRRSYIRTEGSFRTPRLLV
jgi:hypothetical protein